MEAPAEELRNFLRPKLPEYMVPSYFVQLATLPLTPNGKIDRKALPAPEQGPAAGKRAFVAPRGDAERDLVPIWEEVLKVKPVGVTDDFFELGGHSFLAAVLVARIKERLGHTLSLGTLFQAPTIEKLAEVLERNLESGTDSSIVPLQEGGTRPPLFMIAGVGGHVFTFHKFARLIGGDQPVYGVKAIGVDGAREPPDSFEAIAAEYVKEITALRPQGPYILSGYSLGAVVAYELALQLRARGYKVPAVVAFDMYAPGYPPKLPFARRMLEHAREFGRLGWAEKKSYLAERFRNVKVRVLWKLGMRTAQAPVIEGVGALPQTALKKVWVALNEARGRYWPSGKFDGKIVLFKATEGFRWAATSFDDPMLGWGAWTGDVKVHAIPGGHFDMFSDANIGLVAAKLRESLAQAVQGH
jgi:thioesterase domain-containing protein